MKPQPVRLACAVVVLSVLAFLPAAGAPQMVSLVFNGAPRGPQQIGADEFRRKLTELVQHRIAI